MDVELSSLGRRAAIHAALADRHRLAIVDALHLSDRSPTELQETTRLSSHLLTFHLDGLEQAGVIARLRSQGDARRRYVTLTGPFPFLSPPPQVEGEEVVFVCTANSARSQFASFLWSARSGRRPLSAGTRPARGVHPLAVAVAGRHDEAEFERAFQQISARVDRLVAATPAAGDRA